MTVEIRPAAADDADVIVALMERFYAHFDYRFALTTHRPLVERMLREPALGSLWLATAAGTPIGYAALTYGFSFEYGGRDAFVDELFVSADHRGGGVGRQLIGAMQAAAPALGLVAIHLQTESYNQRAKRLYEAVGFVDTKRSTLTWRPAG